jgi:hypothetical protein
MTPTTNGHADAPTRPPGGWRRRFLDRLVNRLDDALADGRLSLSLKDYADVLAVLLPSQFADPPRRPAPTRALPGSAAKLAVLDRREAAGESLWHSDDPGKALDFWLTQLRAGEDV